MTRHSCEIIEGAAKNGIGFAIFVIVTFRQFGKHVTVLCANWRKKKKEKPSS